MELPESVKTLSEEVSEGYNLKELKAAAETLSTDYRERERSGKTFIENDLFAAAYMLSRMPATAGAVSAALAETLKRYSESVETVLDIGAGTGATAIALSEISSIKKVHCVEREPYMLNLGKKVTEAINLNAVWSLGDASNLKNEGYDLVVSSYMLNEIPEPQLEKVLEGMWQSTKGLLLIVDNGTVSGFKRLNTAREILRSFGAQVVAPCPDVEVCPFENQDWCHFAARISRSKIHKTLKGGEVPYEDEKFSYIAVSRTPQSNCNARVLRHPKIAAGMVNLKLCTKDGIIDKRVTKKDKELFKTARKCSAGDEI